MKMIVALTKGSLMGINNQLPFKSKVDMEYFKAFTFEKILIMGRRTAESLPAPLKGRRNVVLTRNKDYKLEGFEVFHDIKDLMTDTSPTAKYVIIGGSEIYNLFMPYVDEVHVSYVETPNLDRDKLKLIQDKTFFDLGLMREHLPNLVSSISRGTPEFIRLAKNLFIKNEDIANTNLLKIEVYKR